MASESRSHDFYLFKILLVGNSGVGKTSMAYRATSDKFDTEIPSTLGIDFRTKHVCASGKVVKLQIWDTSGQERFWAVTTNFFRGAKGALLVYDITDHKSFEDTAKWLKSIKDNTDPEIEILIIGNKCDKENQRKVSEKEGRTMADKNNCLFFETSANSNENIQHVFETLADKIVTAHLEGKIYLTCHETVSESISEALPKSDASLIRNMNKNTKCCK